MRLFSAKPLPKLMMIYGQVGHWEQTSLNINQITLFPENLADNLFLRISCKIRYHNSSVHQYSACVGKTVIRTISNSEFLIRSDKSGYKQYILFEMEIG